MFGHYQGRSTKFWALCTSSAAELKDLTHSFESGVLEQGNMESMQGGVP